MSNNNTKSPHHNLFHYNRNAASTSPKISLENNKQIYLKNHNYIPNSSREGQEETRPEIPKMVYTPTTTTLPKNINDSTLNSYGNRSIAAPKSVGYHPTIDNTNVDTESELQSLSTAASSITYSPQKQQLRVIRKNDYHYHSKEKEKNGSTSRKKNQTISSKNRIQFRSIIRIRPFLPSDHASSCNKSTHYKSGKNNVNNEENNRLNNVFHKIEGSSGNNNKTDTLIMRSTGDSSTDLMDNVNDYYKKGETTTAKKMSPQQDQFLFDSVLDTSATQENVYTQIRQTMISDPSSENCSKQHYVFLSLGVSNSGKTFTLVGDHNKRFCHQSLSHHTKTRNSTVTQPSSSIVNSEGEEGNQLFEDDGIVPRLIHDHFSSSASTSPGNLLQMSMIYIHNDSIYDLLNTPTTTHYNRRSSISSYHSTFNTPNKSKKLSSMRPTKKKQALNYEDTSKKLKLVYNSNKQIFEFATSPSSGDGNSNKPTIIPCTSKTQALQVLGLGLNKISLESTNLNQASSRGHLILSLASPSRIITILDMAGIERVNKSNVRGKTLKESIQINESIRCVLDVLRTLKENQEKDNNIDHRSSSTSGMISKHETCKNNKSSNNKAKIVPYRSCALTMFLQPIFSGQSHHQFNPTIINEEDEEYKDKENICYNKANVASESNSTTISSYHQQAATSTIVTMLISVYPGINDYSEKRTLLKQINALRGLSLEGRSQTLTSNSDHRNSILSTSSSFSRVLNSPPLCHQHQKEANSSTVASSTSKAIRGGVKVPSPARASPLKKITKVVEKQTKRLLHSSPNSKVQKSQQQQQLQQQKIQELQVLLQTSRNNTQNLQNQMHDLQIENQYLLERNAELEEKLSHFMKQKESNNYSSRSRANQKNNHQTTSAVTRSPLHELVESPLHRHIQSVTKSSQESGRLPMSISNNNGNGVVKPFTLTVPTEYRLHHDCVQLSSSEQQDQDGTTATGSTKITSSSKPFSSPLVAYSSALKMNKNKYQFSKKTGKRLSSSPSSSKSSSDEFADCDVLPSPTKKAKLSPPQQQSLLVSSIKSAPVFALTSVFGNTSTRDGLVWKQQQEERKDIHEI